MLFSLLSGATVLFATDYAAWTIAILAAVFVVVVVIGLHVWGAIQDGREEKANYRRRHPS
jgi:hypothetical protein